MARRCLSPGSRCSHGRTRPRGPGAVCGVGTARRPACGARQARPPSARIPEPLPFRRGAVADLYGLPLGQDRPNEGLPRRPLAALPAPHAPQARRVPPAPAPHGHAQCVPAVARDVAKGWALSAGPAPASPSVGLAEREAGVPPPAIAAGPAAPGTWPGTQWGVARGLRCAGVICCAFQVFGDQTEESGEQHEAHGVAATERPAR